MKKYICEECKGIILPKDDSDEGLTYCTVKGCYSFVYSAEELIAEIRDVVEDMPFFDYSKAVDKAEDVKVFCDLLMKLMEDEN